MKNSSYKRANSQRYNEGGRSIRVAPPVIIGPDQKYSLTSSTQGDILREQFIAGGAPRIGISIRLRFRYI
jgi:hypothetical protein